MSLKYEVNRVTGSKVTVCGGILGSSRKGTQLNLIGMNKPGCENLHLSLVYFLFQCLLFTEDFDTKFTKINQVLNKVMTSRNTVGCMLICHQGM
jgi:hypothetical protein